MLLESKRDERVHYAYFKKIMVRLNNKCNLISINNIIKQATIYLVRVRVSAFWLKSLHCIHAWNNNVIDEVNYFRSISAGY